MLAVLAASHLGIADTKVPERARQLASRGRALHDAGNYSDAISAFNEAYSLAPSPGLLFNLAQSYRLAGRCDDAAWMYRRYLDTKPASDKRSVAELQLAAVEKCGHGGLRIAIIPPPLQMMARIPEPPAAEPAALAIAARPRPADPPTGEHEKRIGIALGIGGGVLLAGAGYFAWDAHQAADAVSAAYEKGEKWQMVASIDQRGQRSAEMAQGLGIVGGLTVASGVVAYLVGRHYEQAQHLDVAPVRGGASVRMSWGF
jgi:hypothetical protein